jgi:RNA-splicing ligase RtcB
MNTIGFYCDPNSIEQNALEQLQQYAQKPYVETICAFTDIHFCQDKALPVGVVFKTTDHIYPLITGKDIGCGVMYCKIDKAHWLKPFDKKEHYPALNFAHQQMTDDGLGGGNHFLSIEEDAEAVYIICHTGTRDRGIAMYQQCLQLTRDYSRACDIEVDYVHRDYITPEFTEYYNSILRFGYERRKNFCLKTLVFLQIANYVRSDKPQIDKRYLNTNLRDADHTGELNGTPYMLEDSIHNHLRFERNQIIHRKGSTELEADKTIVIPLSMSRGSLLVRPAAANMVKGALYSCSHGAGRRLSRFDAMKYWRTVLKEKERKAYKMRFSELLGRNGEFPNGYIQEFDFAYKDSTDILKFQPFLKKVTQTTPIVTVKYTEI